MMNRALFKHHCKAEVLEVFEAQAVTTDHTEEMNKPTKRLTISGIVRKVTEEEEPYVQSLWYDRFWWMKIMRVRKKNLQTL